MCAYANTPNKSVIRRCWDQSILERWYTKINRPLSYFGLPGPEMHDLLDWRHLLGVRTGIESPGHTKKEREQADETIGRLNANIMQNGLSSGFQLLRADVEDVIIHSVDSYGTPPQLNDGRPAQVARFKYDVVNLDFDGGLGYKDKSGAAKRVEAIKKLFERQEGHDFILLLTINIRDTLGSEIEEYLRNLRGRDRGEGWQDILDWYLNRPDGEREYKLKATVPSFIHASLEPHMFRSRCRPPIVYEGYKHARMIHFVFELERQPGNLRAFSAQDDRDLIELPLLRSEMGQLKFAKMQHPEINYQQCSTYFDFLPEETRTPILNTFPRANIPRMSI